MMSCPTRSSQREKSSCVSTAETSNVISPVLDVKVINAPANALELVIRSTIEKCLDEKIGTVLTEISNLREICSQIQQSQSTAEKELSTMREVRIQLQRPNC